MGSAASTTSHSLSLRRHRLWIVFSQKTVGKQPLKMNDGNTENLFASDGEHMSYELWEGMQRNMLDIMSARISMIPPSKAMTENPWGDQD